jgi:hypothetical protein
MFSGVDVHVRFGSMCFSFKLGKKFYSRGSWLLEEAPTRCSGADVWIRVRNLRVDLKKQKVLKMNRDVK